MNKMAVIRSANPETLLKYEKLWVATSPSKGEIIAADKDPYSLYKKIDSMKLSFEPLVEWVLPKDRIYAPTSL